MSHDKEKRSSLQESRISLKGESIEFSPTRCIDGQSPRNSKAVKENQPRVISILQQDTLKLERESKALKLDQSAVSSNQGDSLDKDDGYLSSSRQTSTRYSSSCTDDNRATVDPISTYEKIQGILE